VTTKISNQPAAIQPKVAQSTQAAAPKKLEPTPLETKKKAGDTGFADAAKKKGPNMTGRHKPVAKAPVPVKKDLTADVAKLRAAVHAGSTAKPKMDPEVKGALERIKLVAYKGKDAIGDVLKDLEPGVAKEVFKNLPASAKAEISMSTPYGFQPVSVRMAQAQNMSDAELSQVAEAMRGGGVEDLGLQLAVTTEMAARTQWGKDNPEIVDYQRQLVVDGKVNFASSERGAAGTEPGTGEVTLDPSLSRSPEALAATLAHEATHSIHATSKAGMDKSVYNEETTGNLSGARVWSEIGKRDDMYLSSKQLAGLNEYADQYGAFGEDGVQARMASKYALEASEAYVGGAKGEKSKVKDILSHLAADPGAVKAMRAEYAKDLFLALMRTKPSQADVENLGRTLKDMPASAKAALPALISGMDKDAQKALLDAMK
jgi:hypothetical protein